MRPKAVFATLVSSCDLCITIVPTDITLRIGVAAQEYHGRSIVAM